MVACKVKFDFQNERNFFYKFEENIIEFHVEIQDWFQFCGIMKKTENLCRKLEMVFHKIEKLNRDQKKMETIKFNTGIDRKDEKYFYSSCCSGEIFSLAPRVNCMNFKRITGLTIRWQSFNYWTRQNATVNSILFLF